MIHPLVVAPHRCGLPVAMLFIAAGSVSIFTATGTILVLAFRAIRG